MLATREWEFAILGQDEVRTAQVQWVPGRRLPEELIATAMSLGYTAAELDTYSIGELTDDLVIDNAVYFRGALVLPDEQGDPAALFGKPLVQSLDEESVTYQKIIRKGEAKGKTEEARRILMLQGRHRFGEPSTEVVATLRALNDVEKLEDLTVRMLEATSWQDVFG